MKLTKKDGSVIDTALFLVFSGLQDMIDKNENAEMVGKAKLAQEEVLDVAARVRLVAALHEAEPAAKIGFVN